MEKVKNMRHSFSTVWQAFGKKCKRVWLSYWRKWKNLGLGAQIFLSFFFLFFTFEAVIQIIPFLWVINNSLKTFQEYAVGGGMAITKTWQFVNYLYVFEEFKVNGTITYDIMLWNSVWMTAVNLVINVGASFCIAYALAKFRFPGRGLLYGIMIFTQTIPIIGTGAAAFKLRMALGMFDNPWLFWMAWATGFDYAAFVMYGSLQGVSRSYSESAELDGASELQILLQIVFPQVFPLVLSLMVTNFVGLWNDYTTSQVNLPSYPTIAYGMFLFQKGSSYSQHGEVVYFASLVMAALPGVLLYACFQGTIIKNISVGGLKG